MVAGAAPWRLAGGQVGEGRGGERRAAMAVREQALHLRVVFDRTLYGSILCMDSVAVHVPYGVRLEYSMMLMGSMMMANW